MSAKNVTKFKRPDEYPQEASGPNPGGSNQPLPPTVKEVFFRLKVVPASLVQYAVERVTVVDDMVVERIQITERDILPITLSKIEDAIVAQIRR